MHPGHRHWDHLEANPPGATGPPPRTPVLGAQASTSASTSEPTAPGALSNDQSVMQPRKHPDQGELDARRSDVIRIIATTTRQEQAAPIRCHFSQSRSNRNGTHLTTTTAPQKEEGRTGTDKTPRPTNGRSDAEGTRHQTPGEKKARPKAKQDTRGNKPKRQTRDAATLPRDATGISKRGGGHRASGALHKMVSAN